MGQHSSKKKKKNVAVVALALPSAQEVAMPAAASSPEQAQTDNSPSPITKGVDHETDAPQGLLEVGTLWSAFSTTIIWPNLPSSFSDPAGSHNTSHVALCFWSQLLIGKKGGVTLSTKAAHYRKGLLYSHCVVDKMFGLDSPQPSPEILVRFFPGIDLVKWSAKSITLGVVQ